MPELQLSERLRKLLACLEPDLNLADIGTDHGLLAVAAASGLVTGSVIAADINELPLQAARKTISSFALEDRVVVRRSDGLRQIASHEMQQVVIAGMGGGLIREILEECKRREPHKIASCQRFILQPMNHEADLRAWLASRGWQIQREEMVAEKQHFYQIIVAIPGNTPYELTWLELLAGPCLLRQPTEQLYSYLWREQSIRRSIIMNIEAGIAAQGGDERSRRRMQNLRNEVCSLNAFLTANFL